MLTHTKQIRHAIRGIKLYGTGVQTFSDPSMPNGVRIVAPIQKNILRRKQAWLRRRAQKEADALLAAIGHQLTNQVRKRIREGRAGLPYSMPKNAPAPQVTKAKKGKKT